MWHIIRGGGNVCIPYRSLVAGRGTYNIQTTILYSRTQQEMACTPKDKVCRL